MLNPSSLHEIPHYYLVSDRLASSGQPTQEQFQNIASAGYEVIINLALPTSKGALPEEVRDRYWIRVDLLSSAGSLGIAYPVGFTTLFRSDERGQRAEGLGTLRDEYAGFLFSLSLPEICPKTPGRGGALSNERDLASGGRLGRFYRFGRGWFSLRINGDRESGRGRCTIEGSIGE
jgi:hypothetical protein